MIQHIQMDRKMILGIPYRGENRADVIKDLWDQFFARVSQVNEIHPGADFYALSEPVRDGEMHFLVGVEVHSVPELPDGMEVWILTHKDYVVYPHRTSREEIPEAFRHIYHVLLPEAGYVPTDDYDFEVYTSQYYEGDHQESIIYLCVPILSEEEAALSTDYSSLREELIPDGMEAKEDALE